MSEVTKLTIKLKSKATKQQKAQIAKGVIEFIAKRSKLGYAPNGKDWKGKAGKYTEAYAKKKGTSKDGPVDLALSHDMLDAMRHFTSQDKSDEITIGFKKGTKVERKAEGNILGTYGQPTPIRGKARPFLKIEKKDLDKIQRRYLKE